MSSVDSLVMMDTVDKLKEQCFLKNLKTFVEFLCEKKQPLSDILMHHCSHFVELYIKCKKETDPFLHFQL